MAALRNLSAIALAVMLSGAAVPVAAAASQCTRGWAGSVQYTRTQSNSQSKTEDRISNRGKETTDWSMTYNYTANVAVRAAANSSDSTGVASISLSSVSTERKASDDRQICPHERTPRTMRGNFVNTSETRASGSGLGADVSVGVNMDGTYSVGILLPEVRGTVSGSTSSSFSGQCTAREGVNKTIAPMPITVDGVTFSSSGEDRVAASSPDQLSGSHSVSAFGVTETLSWSLRRCGGELRLVKVKFEDMRFPTWNDWQEISEQKGTIDGNLVRMTAIVANDGAEEKSATIKFRDAGKGDKRGGANADGLLTELGIAVPPGEEREVAFQWDSSGYAWHDDGRPRSALDIRAELEESGKKADVQTRSLKVAPKPIVLVHGLWSNWRAWEGWQGILTASHSGDWKAFPVGEKPQHGRMNTGEKPGNLGPTNSISQNADELARYIDYAQKDRNAWHIDLVAHSMGGLISRRYIHATMPSYADGKPQVAHLVMLGTPNMGSRCADLISAPLEAAGRPMEALRELRPSVVEQFNAINGNRKGVEFSVLAGNPLPTVCYMLSANDGVVAVPSALWTITDNAQQSVLHTDMTDAAGFSSFVKPRVAIGPGKQVSADRLASLMPGPLAAGARAAGPPAPVSPDRARIVKLAPAQTLKVPFAVDAGANMGVTFVAASDVSATLIDTAGAVAGTDRSGTPAAGQPFRSLFIGRPVDKGSWTLQLENKEQEEREVVLSTWSGAE